jgi:GH35 family endo-1,4-beta-xylanase
MRRALDTLAQFNLPIRVTEFNLPGQNSKFYRQRETIITEEDQEKKAREIVDFYRICFAHPAVAGILTWGFWEGANWIPASALYKRDWTPTPAAKAYRDLVFREWWTKSEVKADANGRCEIPAFFGSYHITAGAKQGAATLKKPDRTVTVELP